MRGDALAEAIGHFELGEIRPILAAGAFGGCRVEFERLHQIRVYRRALGQPRQAMRLVYFGSSLVPDPGARGIGTTFPPVRLGARPEITVFNLT